MKLISRIGHVALCTPDLDASVRHATELLGLREVERTDGCVFLTSGARHHDLQLIASDVASVDHISFEAASDAALDEVLDRVKREGLKVISSSAEEPGVTRAIRFRMADGHVVEIYTGMPDDQPAHYLTVGLKPRKLGLTTIGVPDFVTSERFYVDVLGFIPSDRVYVEDPNGRKDMGVWMRCNPDHHGLALIAGHAGLKHVAWETESVSALAAIADHISTNGASLEWGIGRHGPGNNIYMYHHDPAGHTHEHLADLERIYDDSFTGRSWPLNPKTLNLWGGPLPTHEYTQTYPPVRKQI